MIVKTEAVAEVRWSEMVSFRRRSKVFVLILRDLVNGRFHFVVVSVCYHLHLVQDARKSSC